MAIRGSLSEASLADVLQLLALGQKTGVLSVAQEKSFASVHFDRGAVWHAALVNRRDRLGDRLVRSGALAPDALARVQGTLPEDDDAQLANGLRAEKLVDSETLERECRAQLEDVVCQLFTWSTGTFAFEPLDAPPLEPIVTVAAESLLMEAARRVDEWTQIAKKIPSMDLIFEVDAARLQQSDVTLTGDQASAAAWLDGTRDVAAVVERSGLGEFTVGQAIYGLVTAGFAQRVGRSSVRHEPAPESRVAEHRNLGVAFYRTGMYDEALREFRRVLELRDDDLGARFHVGLVKLRQQEWSAAIDVLRRAVAQPDCRPAVQLALAYAYERAGDLTAAEQTLADAAHGGASDDPKLALSQAVVALRQGDLPRAEERLATARTLWGARQPSAVWFHHAGLAAAMRGDGDRAVSLLEEGIGVHPHAAVLYNDLAAVQERRGLHEAAARSLEHALLEASGLPQLHKNLADYHYRHHRYDEAFDAYERVVRLAPEHGADVWLKLGNIHYRRGQQDKGRAAWERALAIDPSNEIVRGNLGVMAGVDGEQSVDQPTDQLTDQLTDQPTGQPSHRSAAQRAADSAAAGTDATDATHATDVADAAGATDVAAAHAPV